jgi:hypothetical protein
MNSNSEEKKEELEVEEGEEEEKIDLMVSTKFQINPQMDEKTHLEHLENF